MADKPKRTPNDSRPGSNVWLVLLLVVAAVMVSGFLFSNSNRRLRYPDLMALLEQMAIENGPAPKIRVIAAASDTAEAGPASKETAAADTSASSAEKTKMQAASETETADAAKTDFSGDQASSDDEGDAEGKEDREPQTGARILIDSSRNPDIQIEYSKLKDILVSEESITGAISYRTLGKNGQGQSSKPKEVTFETVRDSVNDSEQARLVQYLDASGVTWDNSRPSRLLEHWPELLMIGILVMLGIFMLRRIGGVGSPMQFSRSRGKLYEQEELAITFDDAAGIDEAVEEVREIVDFLKNSDKYQALGGRIPKGVLLVGPPGTGKTLLAKAIAGEAGAPFFSLSGSDFVEMYVGVGAARVRDMFQQATNRAPCIIFIDELDALGKSRSGSSVGGHDEREQTLNALLVEMDGFDSNNGVIVVAATNRPETLDPALLRPGRFDRHVLVDRPDISGREDILKVHVKNVKLDEEVNLKSIAAITPGFAGADLSNLVNEAALLAARAEKKAVGADEFDEAVERVTAGLEKKSRVMNEDEKIRVAYHEAGHALVAAALPNTDPVHKVSIIPRGLAALGYTMQRPAEERYLMTKSELESNMKVLLAGTLTEEMTFQDISTGAQNDLERCTEIARSMVMDYGMSRLGRINFRRSNRSAFLAGGGEGYQASHSEDMAKMIDKEVARIIDDALVQTREILEQRREVLEAVTQRLLEVESIDYDELMELCQQHNKGPWLVPGTVTEKPKAKLRSSSNDQGSQASATSS